MSSNPSTIYLATYGMLMDETVMNRISNKFVDEGAAFVHGYGLAFSVHAFPMEHIQEQLPVRLWSTALENNLRTLDSFEGVPHYYIRREIVAVRPNDSQVEAQMYFMNSPSNHLPSASYVNTIINGYEQVGHDTTVLRSMLNRLVRRSA